MPPEPTRDDGRYRGPSFDPPAYTVSEFCATHKVSRSMLYKMWAEGTGPSVKNVGVKKIITREAAAEWRRAAVVAA